MLSALIDSLGGLLGSVTGLIGRVLGGSGSVSPRPDEELAEEAVNEAPPEPVQAPSPPLWWRPHCPQAPRDEAIDEGDEAIDEVVDEAVPEGVPPVPPVVGEVEPEPEEPPEETLPEPEEPPEAPVGLADPAKKQIAEQITSSFENSTLELQYDYVEDIGDGRGLTTGRAGFTSGTGDLLQLVEEYTAVDPDNPLSSYLPALRMVNGTDSTQGLDGFAERFDQAADADPTFRALQDKVVSDLYFEPAMAYAESVGIKSALGQAVLYDTLIQHGENWTHGTDVMVAQAGPMSGGEEAWLENFLEIRRAHLLESYEPSEAPTSNSRVDAWRSLIDAGEWNFDTPLSWNAYGDDFTVTPGTIAPGS